MSPPNGAGAARRITNEAPEMTARDLWPEPDMEVLRLHRRPPPTLPIEVFGDEWALWIATAAEAAACPVDYVAAPLLATVSALIGHARWAQATPGWPSRHICGSARLATAATTSRPAPIAWYGTFCP